MIRRVALAAYLLAGCASAPAPAPAVDSHVAAQDRPMVVVVHAEWCEACRRVAPVIAWLHEEYDDRVTFVDLDITDEQAERRSTSVAAPLGLTPFFARNRQTPGITILGRDRSEIHHFTVEGRPGPYRTAMDQAFGTFHAN